MSGLLPVTMQAAPTTPTTQPAAPALTLQPVVRIPVPRAIGSQQMSAGIEFDPVRPVIYVSEPAYSLWAKEWWYAPDAAAVSVLAVVVWCAWRLRRVLRRPQSTGRLYCLACNYDLTPEVILGAGPVRPIPERCPECGTGTKRRRPESGRSRLTRALGLCAFVALSVIAAVVVGVLTLEQYGAGGGWGGAAWPADAIRQVEPLLALQKKEPAASWRCRLRAYDLPSGRSRGVVLTGPVSASESGNISPDGRWYVVAPFPWGPTYISESGKVEPTSARIVIFDLASGARHEVTVDPALMGGQTLVGFSPDGSRAYVQVQSMLAPSPYSSPFAPSPLGLSPSTFETSLHEVTLADGSSKELVKLNSAYSVNGNQRSTPGQGFAILSENGRLEWALFTDRGAIPGASTSTSTVEVQWSGDPGAGPRTLQITGCQSIFTPRLLSGGILEGVAWDPPSIMGTALIDLRTGAVTIRAEPPTTLGSDRCVSRFYSHASHVVSNALTLVDTRSGKDIATLPHGSGWLGPVHFSPDGHWVATVVNRPRTTLLGGTTAPNLVDLEVVVWDLSQLPDLGSPR